MSGGHVALVGYPPLPSPIWNISKSYILVTALTIDMHHIIGLIPGLVSDVKTSLLYNNGGLSISDENIPGDSSYFSHTESSSQSDSCDETETDTENESVHDSDTGGLVMLSDLNQQTNCPTTGSCVVVPDANKGCLALHSKQTISS